MTESPRVSLSIGKAALIAAALLVIGAGAAYLATTLIFEGQQAHTADQRTGAVTSEVRPSAPAPDEHVEHDVPLPDVIVPLTRDAIERAGIVVAPVSAAAAGTALRLPGVVTANAYRQVSVTPLVSGRVTRVFASLGDRVRRGDVMADIYSPELAEATTRYVSARAQLDAHDRELRRAEKLVEIGAASRQELERIHAEHAAQTADVHSARARLELLGVPAATLDAPGANITIDSTARVPAPIDGVVTERAVNVGLNVEPAMTLFTVVDLSTVWVVADAYERDLPLVHVGDDAAITTAAYPDRPVAGRIAYIDPQVNRDTRTAQLRVEVSNLRGELRLGMLADVMVKARTGAAPVLTVPRGAIQRVGQRAVVYLRSAEDPEKFIEREVRLGAASGEQVEVVSGVRPGDAVVTEGSFFVRAERERLGLRPSSAVTPQMPRREQPGPDTAARASQDVRILVNERAYEPATVTLRAGVPARLTFVRTTDQTCGTEVVFPSLNIRRPLPLNEPVVIAFTPDAAGDIAFACGMNMLRGTLVVR